MNIKHEHVIPTLLKSPWFAALSANLQQAIVEVATIKTLKSGQYLHRKGDEVDGLYCLLIGKLRISNLTLNGQELILTWLHAVSWFGEISMFDGLPRTHDAIAEQDCQLVKISNQHFTALLQQFPSYYPHFIQLLCQRVRNSFILIDEMASLSLKGQLCRRLLLLINGLEINTYTPNNEINISHKLAISQESLALMLHSSRQTVNKILHELQNAGVLTITYGQITVFNKRALIEISQA